MKGLTKWGHKFCRFRPTNSPVSASGRDDQGLAVLAMGDQVVQPDRPSCSAQRDADESCVTSSLQRSGHAERGQGSTMVALPAWMHGH